MSVSEKDVKHVALLARLELSDEEIKNYTKQFDKILCWMKKLDELNVDGVEPTAHVFPIENVFREDEVKDSLPVEKVFKNAPDKKDSFFRVPRIV